MEVDDEEGPRWSRRLPPSAQHRAGHDLGVVVLGRVVGEADVPGVRARAGLLGAGHAAVEVLAGLESAGAGAVELAAELPMLFWPKTVLWPQLTLIPRWRWGRRVAQLAWKFAQKPHDKRAVARSTQYSERNSRSYATAPGAIVVELAEQQQVAR